MLNLDKTTFGRAPAAMYLAQYLNEKGDQALARKAGRMLRSTRELLNDLVASHLLTDELKTKSFATLLEMVLKSVEERAALIPDPHVGHLLVNILTGEIRTFKQRTAKARHLRIAAQRNTPEGQTPPTIKATPFIGEETREERVEKLQEKSRKYLARKGKPNTLY